MARSVGENLAGKGLEANVISRVRVQTAGHNGVRVFSTTLRYLLGLDSVERHVASRTS